MVFYKIFQVHCNFILVSLISSVIKWNLILGDNHDSDLSDIFLDSIQLMRKYSRLKPEIHKVSTEDGYVLNLFRMPSKGLPVILAHGIGDSSDSWLVLGPDHSLTYLLSDMGFDVWLYNARGNTYSKGHQKKIPNKQYWDFSFEEMGSRDLPATIDYILQNTSNSQLSYVGFSQGATIFFIMSSLKPKYIRNIKQAVLLAPVAWVSGIKYPFIKILAENLDELQNLAAEKGLYESFAYNPIMNLYHAEVCRIGSPKKIFCDLEYYVSYGLQNTNYLVNHRLPIIASHIPAGTSTKTFLHFIQGYKFKEFQRYDHGSQKNLKIYSSLKPPLYNVSSINCPLTLIYSEFDWFTVNEDIQMLRQHLPDNVQYRILKKNMNFSHLEFIYGSRARTLINEPVIKLLLN